MFLQNVKTGSEANPEYQGALSPGVKWPGREADYCRAEECLELYFHSPYIFMEFAGGNFILIKSKRVYRQVKRVWM